MEECLEGLSKQPEHPLDKVLVALVRVQLMAEQFDKTPWQHPIRDTQTSVPPAFYLSSLRTQLESIRSQITYEVDGRGEIEFPLRH
jgi:hypothetical protein